ncbi:MAG: hypothetical protein H9Q67_06710 [Spiroplasma ixodetis]|nr:hypothetical protein [Spiroplasma ixodetis]
MDTTFSEENFIILKPPELITLKSLSDVIILSMSSITKEELLCNLTLLSSSKLIFTNGSHHHHHHHLQQQKFELELVGESSSSTDSIAYNTFLNQAYSVGDYNVNLLFKYNILRFSKNDLVLYHV